MELQYPPRVIDIHCHLFNACYLPLKGILAGFGVPVPIAEAARDLFHNLTEAADATDRRGRPSFDVVRGSDDVREYARALSEVAAAELGTRAVDSRLLVESDGSPRSADAAESALRADDLYASLEKVRSLQLSDQGDAERALEAKPASQVASRLRDARAGGDADVREAARRSVLDLFTEPLEWLLSKLLGAFQESVPDAALDYLRFFLLMLSSEKQLLDGLLTSYRPEQNVDLFLHLMMDMEFGYSGERPRYAFETKQIRRMSETMALADGRVKGFVAFDPRRGDALEVVKFGLQNGNCGVKLYPPMGFVPQGKAQEEQVKFDELYAYCQDHVVPVVAHCSPVGFEARKGTGVMSSPLNWSHVLARFRDLTLCYAHAGGDRARNIDPDSGQEEPYPGWFADEEAWQSPRNFARMVSKHCRHQKNVYCDFSYHHEATDDPALAANLKRNLIQELERPGATYPLGTKIMYGADWHMPRVSRTVDRFLDFMVGLFDDPRLLPYKDRFFYKNAERFLGLGGGVA